MVLGKSTIQRQHYYEIPKELSNIYMKIAQEDKTLMDKWETKRKIKEILMKRFAEYRQRCEKSCIKIDPQGKIFHFDFEHKFFIRNLQCFR